MSNPVSRGKPPSSPRPTAIRRRTYGDPAQDAVLDVETAAPGDRRRVDPELVPMHEVGVDGRGEQVVRGGHRV